MTEKRSYRKKKKTNKQTNKQNHMLKCRFEFDADFGNDKRIHFNFK